MHLRSGSWCRHARHGEDGATTGAARQRGPQRCATAGGWTPSGIAGTASACSWRGPRTEPWLLWQVRRSSATGACSHSSGPRLSAWQAVQVWLSVGDRQPVGLAEPPPCELWQSAQFIRPCLTGWADAFWKSARCFWWQKHVGLRGLAHHRVAVGVHLVAVGANRPVFVGGGVPARAVAQAVGGSGTARCAAPPARTSPALAVDGQLFLAALVSARGPAMAGFALHAARAERCPLVTPVTVTALKTPPLVENVSVSASVVAIEAGIGTFSL